MKRIALLFTGLLLISTITSAKIWQVNNTGVGITDFTTLQAAHNGATSGDTLYLLPSTTSYGDLTLTKKLIIFGAGYFQRENYLDHPYSLTSITGTIIFNNGSEGSIFAGCFGQGVYGSGTGGSIRIRTSNIKIIRNYSYNVQLSETNLVTNDILIEQNYQFYVGNGLGGGCTNVVIRNNLLITYPSYGSLDINCQCLLINNVFGFNNGSSHFTNQILSNNINVIGSFSFTNCTLSNNIDASGSSAFIFGTSNGNKGGFTSSQIFVGPTGNSTDGQWKLKTGSPAIGAGATGEDCGMFGGLEPYVLSGLPPIPIIKKLITSSIGNNSTPIKVTTSVESKN